MERRMSHDPTEESPLATVRDVLPSTYILSDGPVRYLLVAGDRDDGVWGAIGAFWRSIDTGKGGFIVSPEAIWAGSEMVRSVRSAQSRGWTIERIYAYWQANVGVSGRLMIDPQQHADTLFQVARRVGAICTITATRTTSSSVVALATCGTHLAIERDEVERRDDRPVPPDGDLARPCSG